MHILTTTILSLFILAQTEGEISTNGVLSPDEHQYLSEAQQLIPYGTSKIGNITPDGQWIYWQGVYDAGGPEDQIWIIPALGGIPQLVSLALGRALHPVYVPEKNSIIYSSSDFIDPILGLADPFSEPLTVLDEQDIYITTLQSSVQSRLTNTPGYDSEPTVSPDGKKIVFTSARDQFINLYIMKTDGSDVMRLTKTSGIDFNPRFTPDGKWILFSSYQPETKPETEFCRESILLRKIPVLPFEINIMRTDGKKRRAITELGAASLNACMHPDGKTIVFQSNYGSDQTLAVSAKNVFNIFTIKVDGTGFDQVTHNEHSDLNPQFSPDGTQLIWASERMGGSTGKVVLYSATWMGGTAGSNPQKLIISEE